MQKSIYTPLSGALAQERVMEIIANNLANAQTVGFKSEKVTFKLLEPEPRRTYRDPLPPANYKIPFEKLLPLRGNEISYVGVSGVSRDLSQGSAQQTHNPLDIMIEGDGFLAFHTRDGIRYSRAGDLTLNSEGALVNKTGEPLLGKRGSIYTSGGKLEITPRGEVYAGGTYVDQIDLVTFTDPTQLEKVGGNQYVFTGRPEDVTAMDFPTIRQGFLESSNVNAIQNLTQMILAHRSYEAYSQAIKNFDTMMKESQNKLATVQR